MINNLINNSRFTREEQHFFINNIEIPGVQSAEIEYRTNSAPLNFIGMTGVSRIPTGPPQGNARVNAILITTDQFLPLTGNYGINGYIFKDLSTTGDNFGFVSGYLTSYASTCSIGQIPQIAADIQVFGNAGRIPSSEAASVVSNFNNIINHTSVLPLKIANPNSIELSLNDFNTNRVQSYSVNINVPREPNYILGQRYPESVNINYPIEFLVDFTIDYNDYIAKNSFNFPLNERNENITITLKDLETNENITNYGFSGMQLISERYAAGVDGSVKLTMQYQGFYTR